MARTETITKSSTAEYFAKNLQQVGFSSPAKAVLTTLKEAVDNALDACEEHSILPEIDVVIRKLGKGSLRNTDRILIRVDDNGPGLSPQAVPMVFGEYLASSKFGRGRCSRGQQGIGISAATTWAVQTTASGARVITKEPGKRKAFACLVSTDLKQNKGLIKDKETIDWERPHGTSVEFLIDGRIQMNGEGGILAYLRGTILLNPHLSLRYELPDLEPVEVKRVSTQAPVIPPALPPHPHTMKLGEFISHARLFGPQQLGDWLQKGFSRVNAALVSEILSKGGLARSLAKTPLAKLSTEQFKKIFEGIQASELKPPSTQAVMAVGEEALSMSIQRLGSIDYFAVVSRKPLICDFKPVQVEVAIARLVEKPSDLDSPIQVLRFANRVPLQFDKAACAMVKAISTINWRAYGLKQSKSLLPYGPYIIAISVISPFIKFKNASKETVDASDELVGEIRRALMKAGQQLSRHLRRELKAKELESRRLHIESFSPILVETLCRILAASPQRRARAEEGLAKLLGRDNQETKAELAEAEERLSEHLEMQRLQIVNFFAEDAKLLALGLPLGTEGDDDSERGEETKHDRPSKAAVASKQRGKKASAKAELKPERPESAEKAPRLSKLRAEAAMDALERVQDAITRKVGQVETKPRRRKATQEPKSAEISKKNPKKAKTFLSGSEVKAAKGADKARIKAAKGADKSKAAKDLGKAKARTQHKVSTKSLKSQAPAEPKAAAPTKTKAKVKVRKKMTPKVPEKKTKAAATSKVPQIGKTAKASTTPAQVNKKPAKAGKTPAKAGKTPAKAGKTPAKLAKKPVKKAKKKR